MKNKKKNDWKPSLKPGSDSPGWLFTLDNNTYYSSQCPVPEVANINI